MKVPRRFRDEFRHPHTAQARGNKRFHRWLLRHGRLSPHFTIEEARCHDGTAVPQRLLGHAQRHAFNLEQLRHRLGAPLHVLSWYRTPAYNAAVGGVSQSRHLQADATDFDSHFVATLGPGAFDRAADFVFANGGFGEYPGGSRHVDSRGYRARWTSA